MAIFTPQSKSSAPAWTNINKAVGAGGFNQAIEGVYDLKIDATYKLKIQASTSGTAWSNQAKS